MNVLKLILTLDCLAAHLSNDLAAYYSAWILNRYGYDLTERGAVGISLFYPPLTFNPIAFLLLRQSFALLSGVTSTASVSISEDEWREYILTFYLSQN